jgi:hypothetical protein
MLSWNFSYGKHTETSLREKKKLLDFGHIILIPSQPVFGLTPQCYMLSEEATNTNFVVYVLTQQWLDLSNYCT